MCKDKSYTLEDARKDGDFEKFASEHPSTGNRYLFDKLLEVMLKKKLKKEEEPSKDE